MVGPPVKKRPEQVHRRGRGRRGLKPFYEVEYEPEKFAVGIGSDDRFDRKFERDIAQGKLVEVGTDAREKTHHRGLAHGVKVAVRSDIQHALDELAAFKVLRRLRRRGAPDPFGNAAHAAVRAGKQRCDATRFAVRHDGKDDAGGFFRGHGVLFLIALDDFYLFVGKAVEFVDEFVDAAVGGIDLTLEEVLFVRGAGEREFWFKVKHR